MASAPYDAYDGKNIHSLFTSNAHFPLIPGQAAALTSLMSHVPTPDSFQNHSPYIEKPIALTVFFLDESIGSISSLDPSEIAVRYSYFYPLSYVIQEK